MLIVTLAFWDSSAFVTLVVDEGGSEDAERLWNDPSPAAASRIVVPEVGAALAAARRVGRLDERSHACALREWGRYGSEIDFFELTPEIARRAAHLARTHPLSGADAIHLASALALDPTDVIFATWDRRLSAAAAAERLHVVPSGL